MSEDNTFRQTARDLTRNLGITVAMAGLMIGLTVVHDRTQSDEKNMIIPQIVDAWQSIKAEFTSNWHLSAPKKDKKPAVQ